MDQTQRQLSLILSKLRSKERRYNNKLNEIKESITSLDDSVRSLMGQGNLNLNRLPISFLVAISYIICGFVLFMDPSTSRVSSFYALEQIRAWWNVSSNFISIGMIWCGIMAIIGTAWSSTPTKWKIAALLPQQTLLFLQLLSITMVLSLNQYPDGYVPKGGSWFILADQIWVWMLAIFHTTWFFSLFNKKAP